MKTILAMLITMLLVSGCDTGNNTNPSTTRDAQVSYNDQINQQLDLINQAKKTNNDLITKKAEETARSFLKDNPVSAENWKALVDKIRNNGNSTEIVGQFKTHTYTMRIADQQLKDWASKLKNGDQLIFSGNIGKEMSVTITGGLSNPEFSFFPERIRLSSETTDRIQSIESIKNALKADEDKAKNDTLVEAINERCEDTARLNAFNKRNADFSILHRNITQTDSSTWRYKNNVTLQNPFGVKITYRITCIVKTRVGPNGTLQAKVDDLKFVQ